MKKILFILLSLTFGCSDNESPVSIAVNFNNSFNQGKLTEAKKYSTEASQILLDQSAGKVPVDPDYKSVVVRDSIAGNKAFVALKREGGTSVIQYHLVKIDSDWKIDMAATIKEILANRNK